MDILHFGRKIKDKPSNFINKDSYLSSKPEGLWEEKYFSKQIIKAEFNYDLNMKYFDSLDKNEFFVYLKKIVKKFKFKECTNIKDVDGMSGVYMLVLDNYKQVYIGQSSNIKKRIIGHWTKFKSLERLIFGDLITSILSIDSFGPLDTTRVYYIQTFSTYELEEKIVSYIDPIYLLNRTSGGIGSSCTYTDDTVSAKLAVVANKKRRDFSKFIEVEKLVEILGD